MNNSIVLQMEPTNSNARNSEGAFVTLKDGRILFAWSKFLSDKGGDNEASVISSVTSTDGGQSWSEEERTLAVPESGAHNVMSASLLRLQDSRILMLYLAKTNLPDGKSKCTPIARFSNDEMATLSEEFPLTNTLNYHVVNNDRVIQVHNGTLVVPVALHRFGTSSPGSAAQLTPASLIFYFLSHDGGKTWGVSENNYYRCFPGGGGLQEPGVIQLKDGRLWSWTRNSCQQGDAGRRQWQSFSDDAGVTWSEPEPSVFVSPCSPLSMKRIPSTGDLLAVWNDHSGLFPLPASPWMRNPLVCAISCDEGATWNHHQLLEDTHDHGYCYTAIHFVDDAVLLAYCAGGPRPQGPLQRLRMRRILITELYD